MRLSCTIFLPPVLPLPVHVGQGNLLLEQSSATPKLAGDAGPEPHPTISYWRGGCHRSGSQCILRSIPKH